MELKIEYMPVEDLKPYERNNKKYSKKQIDTVAESIKQFSFVQPIVISKDGTIVSLEALMAQRRKVRMLIKKIKE